jgi:hypothetical protein
MTRMTRRVALALLGAGVAHAQLDAAAAALRRLAGAASYTPTFFTGQEHRLLDTLGELMLPTTPRSPGARAARTADYIDLVVTHSPTGVQQAWRTQLAAIDADARSRAGSAFLALDDAAQRRVLDALSAREASPDTDAVRGFVRVKHATIDAYYTTEIGLRQELGYLGPQMLDRFEA